MKDIEKIGQKIAQNLPLVMGLTILAMDAAAVAAPILAHFGFTELAHIIYRAYSFLCHQRAWRSIHFYDYEMAWCTRDTFIYLSMGLSALAVHFLRVRGVKWYVALLSIIPFALDGLIQLIAEISGTLGGQETFFYASTNFQRMLTGSIFGAGAGFWLFGLLADTIDEELIAKGEEVRKAITDFWKSMKFYVLIVMICIISYIGLVQIWNATSSKYKPAGILDHEQYYPGVNYEDDGKHVV
ncbi:MAG: DUF2085 domain-containing protein [Candidatus Dojkabacteria bacterium]|jgi:uncharacterized membrane protein|nr:DUF2085 domain-containing protein [Candidatus Dojkabacteria bacterium]